MEENESWEDDDEEEVDEINHAKLPSAVIRAHSPGRRRNTSAAWTHLRRINKHDVPGHEMNADCTHVCVCPLADGEEGVKCFCNQPLKLFRASKALGAAWSTTASVAHSKKKHADSDVARKHTGRAEKTQLRLGECMQASGTADIQSSSSKQITYGLSENLLKFCKFIFKDMTEWHRGNPFSQAQHDGGTRHRVQKLQSHRPLRQGRMGAVSSRSTGRRASGPSPSSSTCCR